MSRKKKKKEGSCYIVRCQGEARHWVVNLGYRSQHVCSDCKNYMVSELGWHKVTATAQAMLEKVANE